MDFNTFSQDIESQNCLRFTSLEENDECMRNLGVDQKIMQVGSGKFKCAVSEQVVDNIHFVSDRFNTAVSVGLSLPEDVVCFMIPRTPCDKFTINGNSQAKNSISLLTNANAIDIKSDGIAGTDSILLAKDYFNNLSQIITPNNLNSKIDNFAFNKDQSLPFWGNLIGSVVKGDYENNTLFRNKENVENILSIFIDWTLNEKVDSINDYPRSKIVRRQTAQRAQEYIHSFYYQKITLEQLCRVSGVGVRTLQRCFKENIGFTINKYIYFVRLNEAYRSISSTNNYNLSISSVAHNLGFTHLGRFSTDFKKQFHISPSELMALSN